MNIDRMQSERLGAMRVFRPTFRLFVVARHAESIANAAGVVSSDPSRPVGLTQVGRAQARLLGAQLAHLQIDLAVSSRLLRTQQTAEIALQSRQVPLMIEEQFDEVRAGDFDEKPIETYWSWKRRQPTSVRLPHGESVDDAFLRYAAGLRRLLSRAEPVTRLVIHELALHHIAIGARHSELSVIPRPSPMHFRSSLTSGRLSGRQRTWKRNSVRTS
jgi:broad specificity phosphatase PhoE